MSGVDPTIPAISEVNDYEKISAQIFINGQSVHVPLSGLITALFLNDVLAGNFGLLLSGDAQDLADRLLLEGDESGDLLLQ